MGRVGLVSLGQIAVLALGAWVAARARRTRRRCRSRWCCSRRARDDGAGHARRPAGAAAERALPRADHADAGRRDHRRADHDPNFPNGGPGFLGHTDVVAAATRPCGGPHIATGDAPTSATRSSSRSSCSRSRCWHVRVRPGRAWAAIRQSEPAALAAGVNITLYKLWAFALASFMTGDRGRPAGRQVGKLYTYQFPTQRLDPAARGGADGRDLQLLGRGRRGHC